MDLKCCGWPDFVLVFQNRYWKVVVVVKYERKGEELVVQTECIASIKANVLCVSAPPSLLYDNTDQSFGGRNLKTCVRVPCIG